MKNKRKNNIQKPLTDKAKQDALKLIQQTGGGNIYIAKVEPDTPKDNFNAPDKNRHKTTASNSAAPVNPAKPKKKRKVKAIAITAVVLTIVLVITFAIGYTLINKAASSKLVYSFPQLVLEIDKELDPKRPIDEESVQTMAFTTQNSTIIDEQLWELLDITAINQKRPEDFDGIHTDVKKSYDEAVKILNRYIKNEFTVLEKVRAIHDYLATRTNYDYALLKRVQDYEEKNGKNSYPYTKEEQKVFDIRGVLLNKKAVCDGIAKAFMLLCAIEGIKTAYIAGEYDDVAHAWNKVEIDGNWYVIDVTMAMLPVDIKMDSRGKKVKRVKVLHHGYYLRSDSEIYYGKHVEDKEASKPAFGDYDWPFPEANSSYDFYKEETFNGIKNLPMIAKNEQELKSIFKAVPKSKHVGAIEVKLDFDRNGKDIDDLSAYSHQISNAYKSSGSDFSYKAGSNEQPFVQYPGGVFVFLLYI